MAKAPKTAYVCNDCGAEFSRWQGQCSACKAWNTISEVRLISASNSTKNDRFSGYAGETRAKIQTLSEISLQETPRFTSGFKELDRVLGGECNFNWWASWCREKHLVTSSDVWISKKYDRTLCDGGGVASTSGYAS